jgi:hypothetical protein
MTWRRAAAYWVCFLALSSYYFAVVRQPSAAPPAPVMRAPFLDVRDSDLEGLEVRRDAAVIRCRRVADRWQVVQPQVANVPPDLVAALVTSLTQLPDVEVVQDASTDLEQFGLDPPASQLTLTTRDGRTMTVRLGNRNPSSTAVYAQRTGSAHIFLIGLNAGYYEDLLFEAVRPLKSRR